MIGISMGDANGVGPEIVLRAYSQNLIKSEFVVIGDLSVMEYCREQLNLEVPLHGITSIGEYKDDGVNVVDVGILSRDEVQIGQLSRSAGHASLQYVQQGTLLALEKKIAALVTLPVNKEAIRMTEKEFDGHTGYIAGMCQAKNYTMMLFSDALIVTHVSTHVSLSKAIEKVKQGRIVDVIRMTDAALLKLGRRARIAVAGLNPHAGENNSFGTEDSREIEPAVVEAQKAGIDVWGPIAADTVFYRAKRGDFDAVVCMYHDQGHIPVKLLAFESAVNVTLGLPIIRTSVDHGTAFDIAYKGIASLDSFVNAVDLAKKLI